MSAGTLPYCGKFLFTRLALYKLRVDMYGALAKIGRTLDLHVKNKM